MRVTIEVVDATLVHAKYSSGQVREVRSVWMAMRC